MRILFLADNFPPEVNASASRVFERGRYWVGEGHCLTVLTCAPNFPQGKVYPGYKNRWYFRENLEGIDVVRVKTFMAPNKGFVLRIIDFLSYMVMAILVGAFQQKPTVVVATSPQFFAACAGWFLAKIKRVPFVFEISDLWPESIKELKMMKDSFLYRFLEKVELFLYRQSDLIIAQTSSFKENLVRRGVASDKITVIPNGVDLSQCQPLGEKDPTLLKQYKLEGKFIVGYIGTHGIAQNLQYIMKLVCALPTITFLFIGDGAERESVMAEAKQLGLKNALFFPQQPKDKMRQWWSLCDVALVPLQNIPLFSTVIPSKIFEASGFEVPILLVSPEGEASTLVGKEKLGVHILPTHLDEGVKIILLWSKEGGGRLKEKFQLRRGAKKYSRQKQARDFLKALLSLSK